MCAPASSCGAPGATAGRTGLMGTNTLRRVDRGGIEHCMEQLSVWGGVMGATCERFGDSSVCVH